MWSNGGQGCETPWHSPDQDTRFDSSTSHARPQAHTPGPDAEKPLHAVAFWGESASRAQPAWPPSTCCSSPDSYISIMMSEPPMNSPFTYSCGMVGHWLYSLMPGRISGSSSTFTVFRLLGSTPQALRIWTARPEKPHWGKLAVPFMNSSTGLFLTRSSMRCWVLLMKFPLGAGPGAAGDGAIISALARVRRSNAQCRRGLCGFAPDQSPGLAAVHAPGAPGPSRVPAATSRRPPNAPGPGR